MFEALGGSRFNVNYMRVGGVLHDFPRNWLAECSAFLDQFEKNMVEMEGLITGNEIFEARTQGVGYIDQQQAIAYGLTGPMLRASGVKWDLRVNRPYGAYREVPVNVVVRQEGDCYARYRVRMDEIYESIRLCRVAIDQMPGGLIGTRTPIALRPPRGETYFAIESSKGELLRGHKMSDVIAILGSTDIVLGEVDR
jgi:NADH-quinone oxidoreductase subunit D